MRDEEQNAEVVDKDDAEVEDDVIPTKVFSCLRNYGEQNGID